MRRYIQEIGPAGHARCFPCDPLRFHEVTTTRQQLRSGASSADFRLVIFGNRVCVDEVEHPRRFLVTTEIAQNLSPLPARSYEVAPLAELPVPFAGRAKLAFCRNQV